MPDTGLRGEIAGRECGNGVVIAHEDGWETQYCHMRRGSVAVQPGERVARGQTLGLVGCGRIGGATATKARALGMRVLAFTRSGRELPEGVEAAASLDELLEQSDFVSLHLPLTAETESLIGAPELRRMKPTAFLVNTARGAIVDQAALTEALREGWIGGAGLDVLAPEPPDASDPVLSLDTAIVTPHASFYSEESTVDLQRRAATCVATVLRGELPDTVVNPDVLDRPGLRMGGAAAEASEA
jgi:D-3-phosphoglycerate dehydrogenase